MPVRLSEKSTRGRQKAAVATNSTRRIVALMVAAETRHLDVSFIDFPKGGSRSGLVLKYEQNQR